MGIGKAIGNLLTSAGLGQSDLVEVTEGVVQRIDRMRKTTTLEERDAITFAVQAMIDELRDRDVATQETAAAMHKIVREWAGKK